jgi:chromosome segregation protein
MPSRLKSFELHGYKTFASKSEFQFSNGITAIVGPNGSGKSNIADALRWVLGEQSYGILRAKKTEDLIFSGSENRPRAGMASATIVFDNSDGWLPVDFTEVGITRRAYRDGENEYLLNNQRVRLKDVSEVLAKSGLAERTYTVIGQGLVDAALALRAEERRRLFEEAAGIGLHRSRREEALKRLEATRRNLERVRDILAELQPRLRSLERQAKRVQEYNEKKTELNIILRQYYGYHWYKAKAELVEAQAMAKREEEAFAKIQASQHDIDRKLGDYRGKINELREKLIQHHKSLTILHERREILSREQAVKSERVRSLQLQLEQQSIERNKVEEEIGIQKDQLAISIRELEQLEMELSDARQASTETLVKLSSRQKERSLIEEKIATERQALLQLMTSISQLQTLLSEKTSQVNRLKESFQKDEREISKAQAELVSAQERFGILQRERAEVVEHADVVKVELQQVHAQISTIELNRKETSERIAEQKEKVARLRAEIRVLEEAERSYTGYDEGARILLQAMNSKQLDGALGALGSFLDIPQELENAIASILGEYVDSLIVQSINNSDKALDLIGGDSNRGTIFPLDVITPTRPLSLDLSKAPVDPKTIVGIASHLVSTDEKLKPIVDLLFGHVIIVKDRNTARGVLASRDWNEIHDLRVVTLNGELFQASGPITSGASGKGLLARPRQEREFKASQEKILDNIYELGKQLEVDEAKISELLAQEKELKVKEQGAAEREKSINIVIGKQELHIEKVTHNINWSQDQMAKSQRDLNQAQSDIEKIKLEILGLEGKARADRQALEADNQALEMLPLEEYQEQNTYWTTNIAVLEQATRDAKTRQEEKLSYLNNSENNLSTIINNIIQIENELKTVNENLQSNSNEESLVARKIDEVGKIVSPNEEQLNILEGDHTALLSDDTNSRQLLRAAEQSFTRVKINLSHQQETFDSLRRHIEDDFGLVAFDYPDSVSGPKPLPLDGMVEQLPLVEQLPADLEDIIRQQKAQIRRMGPINPETQEEYREVKERFEFLTTQMEDLSRAEVDIREVIAELDLLMEKEFRRTFDAVSQEFKQIFTRLFGGGSAKLALTDPDNMSETGIDIEARLPGRREQGLALLSGGERSLTATALVFALLRVSPTPFCILDEVDAMLDEANVSRFRDLLTELSEKTQFIVITHNRNTVQAASIIYGVTMGRDSASQVISLRMDELGEEFGV